MKRAKSDLRSGGPRSGPVSRRSLPARSGPKATDQGNNQARTRTRILKFAHSLYTVDGYASVSMRELAKRLGFTAQAIYYYFPSKDAMFAALADEGLRLLEEQHPSEELPDPIDNLKLPFLRYYDFSKSHPEYFRLLWMDPAAAVTQQEPQLERIRRMSTDTTRRIQRCVDARIFPTGLDISRAGTLMLGAVHGAAVMGLTGRPGTRDLDDVAVTLLDSVIATLSAGTITAANTSRVRISRPARRLIATR